jgi:hypothetical protein
MNQFDRLLIEARARDLSFELERERLCRLASARTNADPWSIRQMLGGWFVRAGLWLDSRATERVRASQ